MNIFSPQAVSRKGQMQIQTIKREFLHDILQYNLAIVNIKSKQRHNQIQHERQYAWSINKNIQLQFKRKQQQKRKKRFLQKQLLKVQYENQIKEKQLKKKNQKIMDINFAKNEQEYLNFRGQRRVADLLRMYNRKSYQGVLPQNKQDPYQAKKEKRHVRFKTEALQNYNQNPEYNSLSKYKGQMKYQNYYQDSLDQLQKVSKDDIALKKFSHQNLK